MGFSSRTSLIFIAAFKKCFHNYISKKGQQYDIHFIQSSIHPRRQLTIAHVCFDKFYKICTLPLDWWQYSIFWFWQLLQLQSYNYGTFSTQKIAKLFCLYIFISQYVTYAHVRFKLMYMYMHTWRCMDSESRWFQVWHKCAIK